MTIRRRSLTPRCDRCRKRFDARGNPYARLCDGCRWPDPAPAAVGLPEPTPPRRVVGITRPAQPREPIAPKGRVVQSKAIRNAARGESCTLMIPGVCNGNPETAVMAHLPSPIKGYKSTDLGGCVCACSDCHDAIDGRRGFQCSPADLQFYMRRATILTLDLLRRKGVLTVRDVA